MEFFIMNGLVAVAANVEGFAKLKLPTSQLPFKHKLNGNFNFRKAIVISRFIMKTKTTKQLKIKLKESDADNFKSAIKKIADENKSIGFKKSNLNEDELKVIQQLSDKVNGL